MPAAQVMSVLPIADLRPHPVHANVPLASGEDLAALDASLRENGQQDPIDVTPDGVILDGRTRWTLLQKQGAQTVHVREQDIPESQQVVWIIDRALARRHLSMAEKRALNDYLRSLVIEVREHPTTGEEMRMGMGQTQRAQTLGVERQTVEKWDRGSDKKHADPPPVADKPTHFMRGGGNPTPYPIHPAKPKPPSDEDGRRARARKVNANRLGMSPPWLNQFTRWAHKALPEQRRYLLRIREEVDRALALIDEGGER